MDCESIRINSIIEESIVDGPGLRYVVFTQGCPHHCPGCHNPQTHNFAAGELRQIESIITDIAENPLLSGVTLSGGEPFAQAEACTELARQVHALGKDVLTYSGYTLEQLQHKAKTDAWIAALLTETDTLIDGPYIEELRDLTLRFRGSSNQRIIQLHNRKP